MKTQYLHPHRLLLGTLAFLSVACSETHFVAVPFEEAISSVTAPNKVVTSTETVALGNKQVDFLLVLDDSNSMLPELKKLSARMTTFVSFLEASNIDWQMCVTTTRGAQFGQHLAWKNYVAAAGVPDYVLTKGTKDLPTIFTSTIDSVVIGGGDSGDERAIKSAHSSFKAGGPCYRQGAAVSVIAISDEDERSVGGEITRVKEKDAATAYQPLEAEDLPENLVLQARSSFGEDVRFTFNSIIVRPGDKTCEAEQDTDTSPSHEGFVYETVSMITGGGVGSICDADYSANLNTFKDRVVNSLRQLSLQCEPVEGTLKVWVDHVATTAYTIEKKTLQFEKDLLEGTQIDLNYECKE